MDEATAMRMFVQVVRAESFSEAARRLDLTPSSVSRTIGALEDNLGVRLLNRTTRRLQLTEAGQVYFEHAVRIAGELDQARRAVVELQTGERLFARDRAGQPLRDGLVTVSNVRVFTDTIMFYEP